jgi:hypothetical protein
MESKKYTLMLLKSQRQNIYVNLSNETESIDFIKIWLEVSKKRYLKLSGFYNDLTLEDVEKMKDNARKYDTIVFFDNVDALLNW